jgi:uncharacterized protein
MWLLVVMLVIWAFRDRKSRGAMSSRHAHVMQPEQMVQCYQCAVHFPASEALSDASGRLFCCEEHRKVRQVR